MQESPSVTALRAEWARYRNAMTRRRRKLVAILAAYIGLGLFVIINEVQTWTEPAKDRFLVGFCGGLVLIAAYAIATSGSFRRAHDVRCPVCGASLITLKPWGFEHTGRCAHCKTQLLSESDEEL